MEHREGPADLASRCGVGPHGVPDPGRAGMPKLWELDPLTGERIRAARATDRRYERDAPGDLLHIDVKKLGRIPDGAAGGPTRTSPPATTAPAHESGF